MIPSKKSEFCAASNIRNKTNEQPYSFTHPHKKLSVLRGNNYSHFTKNCAPNVKASIDLVLFKNGRTNYHINWSHQVRHLTTFCNARK